MPWPAMLGALPWTGSKRPRAGLRVDVGAGRHAHAPDQRGGQVAQMSPKRLPVTMTSNWVGSRTSSMAAASTYRCRVSTSGWRPLISPPALLPEAAGVVHRVGLVDEAEPALGALEPVLDDAADAVVRVEVLLDGRLVLGAAPEAAPHAHVGALGVLAHDEQVHRPALGLAQRAEPVVVEARRPQVHVEVELEAASAGAPAPRSRRRAPAGRRSRRRGSRRPATPPGTSARTWPARRGVSGPRRPRTVRTRSRGRWPAGP